MDRHEFENYLLDENILKAVIDKHHAISGQIFPEEIDSIKAKLFEIATNAKEHVIRKEVNRLNGRSINKLLEKFRSKSLPIDTLNNYNSFLSNILTGLNLNDFLALEFETNYNNTVAIYSDDNWTSNWQSLCDGKIVLGQVLGFYARYLQITVPRLKNDIKQLAIKDPRFEINGVINTIIEHFKTS